MTDAETRSRWDDYLETVPEDVAALRAEYPDRRSLWVDVIDLYDADEDLADALFRSPDETLAAGAAVLRDRLDATGRVTVRVENHPALLGVEDLRAHHVGELVSVEGLVREPTRRVRLETARLRCSACGEARTEKRRGLSGPAATGCPDCGSDAMGLDADDSTFIDTQVLDLEPAADTEADRSILAHLDDDIAGAVEHGDAVVLTGVLRPEPTDRSNVFDTVVSTIAVEDAPRSGSRAETGLGALIDAHWSAADRRS